MKKIRIKFLKPFKDLLYEKHRNLIYYGGRYSGKSYHIALALLLRGRNKKLRILCTREIQNTIRDSVHKLLKDLIDKYDFSDYLVQKDTIINLKTGSEFIFRGIRNNTNEIKSTEGVDICWVEEAQAITKNSLDILTPTIRKEGSQMIFSFNRLTELDPVYVSYVLENPPNTLVVKVNYDVLERNGLLTKAILNEMDKDRNNPDVWSHKWLGEPIGQAEFSVIPRQDILDAMDRKIEGEGQYVIGADIARFGGDRIVFWKRKGMKTIDYKIYQKLSTPETCDLLEEFVRPELEAILKEKQEKKPDLDFDSIKHEIPIKIDDTGVGGGVTDELNRRGYYAVPINFGSTAQDKDKYPNLISEAWFYFKDNIKEMELPKSQELLLELSTRQWHHDNKERRVIESKDSYKKRGFRSPDCFVAGTLISTPKGKIPIEKLKAGDYVYTPMGNRRIIKTWEVNTKKLTYTKFSNGNELIGKGKHKVFTWDNGWVYLNALLMYNKIETDNIIRRTIWKFYEKLFIMAKPFGFKHQVDIINQETKINRKDFYIEEYGLKKMVRYPAAAVFTILIMIGQITKLTTLNLLKFPNTLKTILKKIYRIRNLEIRYLKGWKKQEKRQSCGINQKKVLSGIENMGKKTGLIERKQELSVVKNVVGLLKHIFLKQKNFVIRAGKKRQLKTNTQKDNVWCVKTYLKLLNIIRKNVVPVHVRQKIVTETKVYNLTLDKDNVYYANGILVENCADACIICYYNTTIFNAEADFDFN